MKQAVEATPRPVRLVRSRKARLLETRPDRGFKRGIGSEAGLWLDRFGPDGVDPGGHLARHFALVTSHCSFADLCRVASLRKSACALCVFAHQKIVEAILVGE